MRKRKNLKFYFEPTAMKSLLAFQYIFAGDDDLNLKFKIPTLFPQCSHRVPKVFQPCSQSIHTVFPECPHHVTTVFPPRLIDSPDHTVGVQYCNVRTRLALCQILGIPGDSARDSSGMWNSAVSYSGGMWYTAVVCGIQQRHAGVACGI